MEDTLVQFYRGKIKHKGRGNKGALVAKVTEDRKLVVIGWSLCGHGDEFDKDNAIKIASGRACKLISGAGVDYDVPTSLRRLGRKFQSRARNYFKDAEVVFANGDKELA